MGDNQPLPGRSQPAEPGAPLINRTIPGYGFGQSQRAEKAKQPKSRAKWSRKRKVFTAISVVMILIIGAAGWIDWNLNKVFHCGLACDLQALNGSSVPLKGESQGRVNILLAGYQGSASDEGPLTDSIMVVSIDTQNHTAFTMSIPRDLWVNIPGTGHQKINAANTYTNFNQAGYFHGGMGQLQQIIQQDFGIPIDYYGLINYTAFKDAVNAVGGITVNIQSPDPRGLYDPNVDKVHGGPLKLPNGPVKLNGLQALALALARGDSPYAYGFPLSDINREQHQRQMLIALEQKASSTGVLSNPITITNLFNAIGANVKTDLNLSDALSMIRIVKSIKLSSIQSYGLNYSGSNALLTTYVAPDGEDALIPKAGLDNFSQIQNYYLRLTSNSPVVQEDASVVVLNASNTNGLANKEANILKSKGFNVTGITDANSTYPSTMIVDNSNGQKPASLKLLQQLFPGTTTNNSSASQEASEAQTYNANFVVILGQNWDSAK